MEDPSGVRVGQWETNARLSEGRAPASSDAGAGRAQTRVDLREERYSWFCRRSPRIWIAM